MKIEITGNPQSRTFNENTFWSQEGYIHKEGQKYPTRLNVSIENQNKAFALGFYVVDLTNSTYVGQYDSLQFSRFLTLLPVKE